MRAQRQKISLLEQGGADEQDIINARGQYRATSAEYARFSQAMGLPQQRERVTVDGLGDIGKGKTKGAEPVPQIRPTRIGSTRADTVTDQERAELLTRPPESGIIEESKAHKQMVEYLDTLGVESVPIKPLSITLSESEIIDRLAGGDMTKGSCTSLAFAYAGNKGGVDVLDFRGGESCDFFSKSGNIKEILKFKGVKGMIRKHTNDFSAVSELLKTVENGKEYILVTGKHTAVIRKAEKGFEYLNMQDPNPKNNCFKPLTTKSLKSRFACQKSYKSYGQELQASSILFDRESLSNSVEFKDILRYINTNDSKQMKGVKGHDR